MTTLEERVTALEERMDREAGLRASQDRDQSAIAETLRVHGRLIQALADTQKDHTKLLLKHGEVLDLHTKVLNEHTEVLDKQSRTLERHGTLLGRLTMNLDQVVAHLEQSSKATARVTVIQDEHGRKLERVDGVLHEVIGKLDTLIQRGDH